jgi:phosphoribosyl 1,2-cyclic phosphodiesterase
MEVTFWGVRGSIAAPGPTTVRYGGNTSCVSVRLSGGHLVILDCGTGARNLGLQLLSGAFGRGQGRATFLLSHAHWDHIQGFPFFGPFYVAGNSFTIHGGDKGNVALEEILEGQMAAQYFPVQTIKNMGARIAMKAMVPDEPLAIEGAVVRAHPNPHGSVPALAFRIEDGGRTLTYASDAGYGVKGPSPEAVSICGGADLLIHDSTYTPEDRALGEARGLASLEDAVDCAVKARVKKLALFHYDQDYSDHEVDDLVARGRRMLDQRGGQDVEIVGAAEGLTIVV